MTAKEIKLFDDQPELTQADIDRLTQIGLLVPAKSPRKRPNCGDEITNPTAGEVVSYRPLDEALRKRLVNQEDARRLLAIETARPNGHPRESHILRLMVVAFSNDKGKALAKIKEISQKLWLAKNPK